MTCSDLHAKITDGGYCTQCGSVIKDGIVLQSIDELPQIDKDIHALQKKILAYRKSIYWAWGVIALQLIGCFLFLGLYSNPSIDDGSSSKATALASFAANDAGATTAAQQQVVNGWVARDLLSTIADQNSTLLTLQAQDNYKTHWLLFNGILSMTLIGIALIRLGLMFQYQSELQQLLAVRSKKK